MTFTRKTVAAVVLVGATAAGFVAAAPALAAAPTITSFTPTSGKLGTTVTITGTGFASPATVKFNGATSSTTAVKSSTTITATVPGTASSGPISVTTAGGTVTTTTSFTVTAGVVLSRTSGPPTAAVTAYFSGFTPTEAVDVYLDTTDLTLVATSTAGAGSTAITIPATATPGTHWITTIGRKSGISAQTPFLVRTDWAQQGYNAAQTGANPYEGTLGTGNVATLTRAWNTPMPSGVTSSESRPLVVGGTAYIGTSTGIAAYSESTGALVWSQPVSGGVYVTPTVSAGLVLVGTSAHLLAFAASTGVKKYDFGFSGQDFLTPIVVSGTMAFAEVDQFNGINGAILGFDVASGTQDWSTPLNTTCSGLAVAGGTVYTSCADNTLRALVAATGAQVFTVSPKGYVTQSTPVVANGVVVTAGHDTTAGAAALTGFDDDDGTTMWTQDTPLVTGTTTTLTADRGSVFLASTDPTSGSSPRQVSAFAMATGEPLWTTGIVAYPLNTAVADGVVYASGLNGIAALDENTGAVLMRLRGAGPVTVTDAGLIASSPGGSALYRYTLPAPATSSAAPQVSRLQPDRALRAHGSTI